jgi:hypothetical protein
MINALGKGSQNQSITAEEGQRARGPFHSGRSRFSLVRVSDCGFLADWFGIVFPF